MKNVGRTIKVREEGDGGRQGGMRPEVKKAFDVVLARHDGAFKMLADCDAGKIPRPARRR
jgi:hypothetical protein